jgi:hypothetical protein
MKADWAAGWLAAAAEIEARQDRLDAALIEERGELDHETLVQGAAVRDTAGHLRRVADEARPETQARRGDAFEAWLKAQRDQFGHKGPTWVELDNVVDRYRLHADTGTPLSEHVCEGKVAGDCGCLEQFGAGPQPGAYPTKGRMDLP